MKPEMFRKLTYTSIYQPPWIDSDGRQKTEWIISSDGRIKIKEYKDNFHKPISVISTKVSNEKYKELCREIAGSMNSFDYFDWYVDDCCETLVIDLSTDTNEFEDHFGRITLDRGFGNGETDIGSIIHKFLSSI